MSTLQNFGIPTGPGQGRGGILQPKVKFKFRVIVTNFGIPAGSIALTQQVTAVGRPHFTSEAVPVHAYNSVAYFGGKPTWEPVTLTVRDDITNSVSSLVGAQLTKQQNFFTQVSPASAGNYKFQMLIDTMDGSDDTVLEEWFLEGCFLTDTNYEGFDYSSSESMTIEMSIRYDNATQVGGLMPMLPLLSPSNGYIF